MKYTLWYSCYIDLFHSMGVGSSFVESPDGLIQMNYCFAPETTINELSLMGILSGLEEIPKGSDIDILGVCSYADQALTKLKAWIENDELDSKAHSWHLKHIWSLITQLRTVQSHAYRSRRADPMLWVSSLASQWQFRKMQERAIEALCFPKEPSPWRFSNKWKKSDFLSFKFQRPMTENALEKAIIERKKIGDLQERKPEINNVISFEAFKGKA